MYLKTSLTWKICPNRHMSIFPAQSNPTPPLHFHSAPLSSLNIHLELYQSFSNGI